MPNDDTLMTGDGWQVTGGGGGYVVTTESDMLLEVGLTPVFQNFSLSEVYLRILH